MSSSEEARRQAAARQTRRDLERLSARIPGDGFWAALRVLGSIGWPIALLTLLGAALGRLLGRPWLTALLIALGALAGAAIALSGLRGRSR